MRGLRAYTCGGTDAAAAAAAMKVVLATAVASGLERTNERRENTAMERDARDVRGALAACTQPSLAACLPASAEIFDAFPCTQCG